jgi:hypothetical protein
MFALRFCDITFISVLAVLFSSTLIRDFGGELKPYEARELHAMWDDFLGDTAAAAELRDSAPRPPWTAPSLDQSEVQAVVAEGPMSENSAVLLGEPLPLLSQVRIDTVGATELKIPLDCAPDGKDACGPISPPKAMGAIGPL